MCWAGRYRASRSVTSPLASRAIWAALPSIVSRHKPEHTDEEPVIFWQETEELVEGVAKHVSKFNTERIEFHTKDDGLRYFSRAGRRKAKVFISNAAASNALAQKLIVQLRLESMDFFHYQVTDAIPIGDRWLPELERQIGETGIFIALITNGVSCKAQWCIGTSCRPLAQARSRGRAADPSVPSRPRGCGTRSRCWGSTCEAVDLSRSDEADQHPGDSRGP